MARSYAWDVYVLRCANWFQALRGWYRFLVLLVLGCASGLGFAPFYFWPIWLITIPGFVWTLDGVEPHSLRRSFVAGWAFGFGYFLVGMHWIGYPFVVDADRHGWLLPFVIPLFPGGLAIFWGLAAVVAKVFWRADFVRVLVISASVAALEWLRGNVLTGLPWNLPGYVWANSETMMQSASLLGVYGLSLVSVLAFASPALLVNADGETGRTRMWALGGLLMLAGLWVFGSARLPNNAQPVFEKVELRLVQPNVPQREKWKLQLLQRNWQQLVDLTTSKGMAQRNVIIWPEAAPPFPVLSTDGALGALAGYLPDRTTLLTGTQRVEPGERNRYFNSMVAVDGRGQVIDTYDKSHLVPFGEYLPLFELLGPLGVSQLTGGNGGFTQGNGVRTLIVPGLPSFGVLICYEVIFPGAVVNSRARPEWLVNLTDDSWFGPWAGPYQHLGIARVRAVEEGLSIVRSANTGVSAVIDPYGRIIASLELNKSGVVDAKLPKPTEPTLFSIAGHAIFALLMLVLVGAAAIFSRSTP